MVLTPEVKIDKVKTYKLQAWNFVQIGPSLIYLIYSNNLNTTLGTAEFFWDLNKEKLIYFHMLVWSISIIFTIVSFKVNKNNPKVRVYVMSATVLASLLILYANIQLNNVLLETAQTWRLM